MAYVGAVTKKPCIVAGCELPKYGTKHRCRWHWVDAQPIETQEREAARRLEASQRSGADHRARVPASEWPEGYRWCSGCQWMVPLWYARGSRCRACSSRASHRAATAAKYEFEGGDTYDSLLARQGGRCAICRCTPRTRRLAVDHDHTTNAVRGLLCSKCNHELLGAAHDSIELLERAVAYLKGERAPERIDYEPPPF